MVRQAVRSEWKSAEDSCNFWTTDYNDDEATKLLLMKKLKLVAEVQCHNCSDLKEWDIVR